MLMGLRKSSETWMGRIVLGLVMGIISISFAIWGIGNIFHGFGHSTLATVGGSEVSVTAFRQAFLAQLDQLKIQTQRTITNDQAHAMGLDKEVLTDLIADAALTEKAKSLGLALSGDQLRKAMVSDPNFRDQGGNFDPQRMNGWLRERGHTQADLANVYMQRQIATAIVGELSPPRLVLEAFNRYAAETRSVTYAVLPASVAGDIPAPSDAAMQKFYDDRKAKYRSPEFRDILVLAITPQTLAKPAEVSDDDARKLYDQIADGRFGRAERRTLQQLTFPTEAEAQAALAKIKAGKTFADIAKERNLAPGDVELGKRTKNQVADVADAAFSLPEGGISDPIKSRFGYAVVRVVDITPGNLRPFADVATEVKKLAAASRVTRSQVDDLHEKIESLRASGKPLTEAAKAVGLTPRAIPAIDAGGRDKTGALVPGVVDGPALLKAVFASDVGLDNDTLQTPEGGYEWFEIRKIEPARDRGFAEVKPEVEKAWRSAETTKALTAKASELYKRIDAGASLESVIPDVKIETASDVTRNTKTGLPPTLVTEVFNTPPGMSGSAAGEGDSRIVFKVTGSKVPPFDPAAPQLRQLSNYLAERMTDEVIRQYAARLETEIGSKIDPQALRDAAVGSEPIAPIDMD